MPHMADCLVCHSKIDPPDSCTFCHVARREVQADLPHDRLPRQTQQQDRRPELPNLRGMPRSQVHLHGLPPELMNFCGADTLSAAPRLVSATSFAFSTENDRDRITVNVLQLNADIGSYLRRAGSAHVIIADRTVKSRQAAGGVDALRSSLVWLSSSKGKRMVDRIWVGPMLGRYRRGGNWGSLVYSSPQGVPYCTDAGYADGLLLSSGPTSRALKSSAFQQVGGGGN